MKIRPAPSTLVLLSWIWPAANGWAPRTIPKLSVGHDKRSLSTLAATTESTTTTTTEEPSSAAVLPEKKILSRAPSGRPIADGTLVSFFRGGLAVVQIGDEVAADVLAQGETDSRRSSNNGDEFLGHQVLFPNGAVGVVVAYRPPIAFVYSTDLADETAYATGGVAKVLDSVAKVRVTDETHIVDCFGLPLDDFTVKMDHSDAMERPIFSPIPQIKDISLINSPMLTGTTMVDALAPIGKGQNMLLIGHELTMMRGFVLDLLSSQRQSTKCVYAVTKDRSVVVQQLRDANLLDDVIVVATRLDDASEEKVDDATRAAEATVVAATACAIAEAYALTHGHDALVVVDTLDQHKELWSATTRTLVDMYGADAVVRSDQEGGSSSEMRAFYSSLIQRAAQYNEKRGGGSVTLTLLNAIPENKDDGENVFSESDFDGYGEKMRARLQLLVKRKIPLTADNLRKIDIPTPSAAEGHRRLTLQYVDELISMSDGQIWLDESLVKAGQLPPMDPQRSITRIGIGADTESRADAPAVRRVAEGVRLELAQASNMEGAEVTEALKKQIRKRNAWLLAMHQEPGKGGRTLSESCVALLAASTGSLDKTLDAGGLAGTEMGQETIENLIKHVRETAADSMTEIDETLDITSTTRKTIIEAIESFSG